MLRFPRLVATFAAFALAALTLALPAAAADPAKAK